MPVETEGFELSTSNRLVRPKIRISNKDFIVTDVLANGSFYYQKYQNFSFNPPTTPYFNPSTTGRRGYIFNQTPQGLSNPNWPAGTQQSFVVGGPNHFYFGLNKGKSAINRYIKAYILNQDE
jgi:hypothetical protein